MRNALSIFLLCGVVFAQADSIATAKSLEHLQDQWQMQELENQVNTIHAMYSPHALKADGTRRTATDAERASAEQAGKDRTAAIRKDFQGRTKSLITQGLGMRAKAKKTDRENAVSKKLQGGDYGWQEVSFLAKALASQK